MAEYEPGVFATKYRTDLGQEIWRFLNDPENIIRMETATGLQRPAVEGIEEALLGRFGERILADRVKQMIGHMVRQIMERNDYVVAQQNVKMMSGAPFSRATRYQRRDDMTFHVFRNSTNPRLLALTGDKAGSHLPENHPESGGRWLYWKSFRGGLRGRIAFGLNDEKLARTDVIRQGYHIYNMGRMLKAGTGEG